jgi:hypothetical protein
MQDCGRGGGDRPVEIRRIRSEAEASKERQRILEQGIVALEGLDQLFLAIDRCGQPIDGRIRLGIDRGCGAQTVERIAQRVDLFHERIIVAQRAGARCEDIAI